MGEVRIGTLLFTLTDVPFRYFDERSIMSHAFAMRVAVLVPAGKMVICTGMDATCMAAWVPELDVKGTVERGWLTDEHFA